MTYNLLLSIIGLLNNIIKFGEVLRILYSYGQL